MKKCSDLIEKHICDRQTQNLRLRDPLVGCARFQDLGRICRDFSFFRGPFTTPTLLYCVLRRFISVCKRGHVLLARESDIIMIIICVHCVVPCTDEIYIDQSAYIIHHHHTSFFRCSPLFSYLFTTGCF